MRVTNERVKELMQSNAVTISSVADIRDLCHDLLESRETIEKQEEIIKEMREVLQWVQKTQKVNYGHATDLHLDMLDFPRKYDNVLKKSEDYAE